MTPRPTEKIDQAPGQEHPSQTKKTKPLRSEEHANGKARDTTKIPKNDFSVEINKTTTDPQRSPPSLPHMVNGMKIEFWAHSESRKYQMKLENWQGAPSL
jgi:hypothetical protein